MREYLSELLSQHSTRDALELLGYGRNSFSSLDRLCSLYGVEIPKRVNQNVAAEAPQPSRLKVLRPANRKKVGVEKCMVVGDIHAPFHDERAVNVALALAEDIKPEVLVLNGDILDAYSLSRFSKDPHRALMLQDELDVTRDILERFRAAVGNARIVYIEGNHEARLRNYLITRAPELSGLRAMTLESMLDFEKLGIEYIPSRGRSAYWRYGAITIGHFDLVRKKSGYTETALLDDRRESVIQGHTHRVADVTKRLPSGVIGGIGSGCLCELDPEYCIDPDWVHAVVVITKRTDTDRFHTDLVKIIDHEALYNDTLYSG